MEFMIIRRRGKLLFDRDYQNSVKITRKTFHALYDIYCHFLKLTLRIKSELARKNEINVDGEFNKAFLILLNRSIQHTESIIILTERGLYGDAFSLYRNIISDSDMACYLHFKPELINTFIAEKQDTYQTSENFKNLFSDYVLQAELKKRGLKSTTNIFKLFSKASHASAFGAQLYSRRAGSSKNTFYLKYGPGLERERALIILFITMLIHKDFANIILWHRKENGLDISSIFWINILEDIKKMDKDIEKIKCLTLTALDKIGINRI